jgi:hypothetical protein
MYEHFGKKITEVRATAGFPGVKRWRYQAEY